MNQKLTVNFRKKFEVNPGDDAFESVSNEIFKYREYRSAEPIIMSAKNLIIDAGAHIGLFTLYCRALNKKVKIIALEPEKKNYEILRENLKGNKITGVEALKLALSSSSGIQNLAVAKGSHNHRLIVGSEEVDKTVYEKIIQAKTVTLDDLLNEISEKFIDLLKMDIEGSEFAVVSSWSRETFLKISCIILEYHDTSKNQHKMIEKLLRENGFGIQIYPSKFDKNMGFIWAQNKKLRRFIYEQ